MKTSTQFAFWLCLAIIPASIVSGFQTGDKPTSTVASSEKLDTQNNKPLFKARLLTVDSNEGIAIADIDNDGQADIVAGRNWFPAPNFTPRPLRIIEDWNGYVQSNGDFVLDVNQDGFLDVIAGAFVPTRVHWYKNPGTQGLKRGQIWEQKLLFDTQLSQNEFSFLRDLDGDQTPDWISNSWNKKNPVVVWKLTLGSAKNQPTFKKRTIGDQGNTHGMGFGDINNDGREDILISTGWYERPEKNTWSQRWKFHPDWNLGSASCPIYVRDLDQDGKNDLVWGKGHDFGLFWWKRTGTQNGKLVFEEKLIDDRFSQPHALHFVDLDGDGNEELVTGKRVRAHNGNDPGGREMPCMYFYKWNTNRKRFQKHTIDEGHIGTGLQIASGDLNQDGRTDLAVAGKDGTWLLINQIPSLNKMDKK